MIVRADDITWEDLEALVDWCHLTMGGGPEWKWDYEQEYDQTYAFTFMSDIDATAFKLKFGL